MAKTKHITLGDIAKELNISIVAVSKALRDQHDISFETKQTVKATASKLGYVPNFMARNLSSRRSNTIGLVVPKIVHHFFPTVIEAIYKAAYENDFEIILAVSQENAKNEAKHIRSLLGFRVDGLLVSVTEQTTDKSVFRLAQKRAIPLVFFDRVLDGLNFSTVTVDDEGGAYQGITEFLERGFTKIGHLAGYTHTNIGKNRLNGFLCAMIEKDITVPERWIRVGGFDQQAGYNGFNAIYSSGSLPELIFAVTYPVALGVYRAAREKKIEVPRQLQILSFGGTDYDEFISPPISYIDQPAEKIASRAFQLILSQIKNPDTWEEERIIIPTRVVNSFPVKSG